ncbi:glycerol-3-phosphate acyltransferase [Planococcus sp. ISL-109]|uniref:glycerol-3-phosphate acyltransferase n=1 Tax=Planococcus sp. ISL-109 TaxID=2819166 RepID=UPI001BE99962|nr:glycerol-3-phosphate acyltransferase [Planococcus sp. ISL-109]MBT2583075.1 glycerol-3-phosphate acyltransferase [Planococcus sp. ISL-109]
MVILYWICSYLLGTVLTALLVGKWTGVDLTTSGSGNPGARNAFSVIGKRAFLLVFLGDFLKGSLVVWAGLWLDFSLLSIATAGLLAVVGHMFPVWQKGRGGKGISTFAGVAFWLTPDLFLAMLVMSFAFYPWLKSTTLSMLAGFSVFFAVSFALQVQSVVWPLFLAIIIIVIRHKSDIRVSFENRFPSNKP